MDKRGILHGRKKNWGRNKKKIALTERQYLNSQGRGIPNVTTLRLAEKNVRCKSAW